MTLNKARLKVRRSAMAAARGDFITGGITIAAILMFVSTGSAMSDSIAKWIQGAGGNHNGVLASTVLLNIALIMFGWRRYRDLQSEVAERTAAELQAKELASIDPLTGFLNRRSLDEEGGKAIARTAKSGDLIALFMLDLDHFKNINDANGHAVGDLLLKRVAETIRQTLPPGSLAARMGGDEFVCAFPYSASDPTLVDDVARTLVKKLSEPYDLDGVFAHIGASLGIARLEDSHEKVDELIRRADIAMYVSKKRGRNRYCWFDASMEQELQSRNTLEQGMRTGIPRGEFVPYFEQQVDIKTGQIRGFEMLARWESPNQGVVCPEAFIPIAEETGLIGELSLSVIRQAMIAAKGWDHSLTISVNISPVQLRDAWLAQKLVKLLVETGFPAERLEIEITESSLFENMSLAQSIVGSLKNQGVKLALDDFGTGYSSLAHLRALPFDRIKIDRSFVTSINENGDSAAIVTAIARLGDSLGMSVTAEGIETQDIELRLNEIGIDKGQGWLYGHPLTVKQAEAMLTERGLLATRMIDINAPALTTEQRLAAEG